MSHPPGIPDQEPVDPWATPVGPTQPSPAQQLPPAYGQAYPPQYGQPYPPQYGQQPPYQAPWGLPPRPNGKAQAAMWTGIAALVLTFCCLGGILGFVPVILGVLARREIRASGGQQTGGGMALTGIITGAVALVLAVLLIIGVAVLISHGDFDSGSTTTFGTDA